MHQIWQNINIWCSLCHFFLLFSVWPQRQDIAERRYLFPQCSRDCVTIQRGLLNRKNIICQSHLKQQSKWKSTAYKQNFLWWVGFFQHLFIHIYRKLCHNSCRQGIIYEACWISRFTSLIEWLHFGCNILLDLFQNLFVFNGFGRWLYKLKVPWLWFISVQIIFAIRFEYIFMWFYTIHMYTEYVQSQDCAYPNTIFCAEEQKTIGEHFNFFIFNIKFLFWWVLYSCSVMHRGCFILFMHLNISHIFLGRVVAIMYRNYSYCFILCLWGLALYMWYVNKYTKFNPTSKPCCN